MIKTVQIDTIPRQLLDKLDEKGIASSSIILAVRSDMNKDGVRCDNWLVVTESDLIVIGGAKMLVPRPDKKATDSNRLSITFGEISYDYYPLESLSDFKVEDLISTARLVASKKEDENSSFVLLTYLTNEKKDDINQFIKYLGQYKEKKEITEDEKKDEVFCPKCKRRYADPNRKICPRCMDKGKLIRRMGQFVLRYKFSVLTIIATLILTSALNVFAPYISSGFFYDQVLDKTGKFYGQLLLVLGIIIATRVISMLVNMMGSVISSTIAAKVTYDLKKVIFTAIERLSISFFTGRQTGGLMNQINNDATSIYWFYVDGLPYIVINLVQAVAIVIIMFWMSPVLAAVAVFLIPLVILCIIKLFKHMGRLYSKRYSRSRALNSALSDVLSGVRVVKAFSKENEEIKRFDNRSIALAREDRKVNRFNNMAFPGVTFLFSIGNILVTAVGGWMVIQDQMTYGTLLTFMVYMNMIYDPMFFFVDMANWASECMNSLQRLVEIMDANPDVIESENPVVMNDMKGRVTFKDVEFCYEKNRKVIDKVSFDIDAGKVIGIVGHTGAGKSTLANLLIRLYDVTEGEIQIDGVNIKDISFNDLRQNIAIVSQETYLFAGTILDNIKYAKPEATNEEVILASKISGAHDFIIKMPDAYSTRIGFGYKDLSGGERQRISIARAILRNPKILILDEATAAMDTETERQIQRALEKLVIDRTTIMIAHRLSTLRDADYLIVIENGKMPESGTHLELLNKKGIYYNLYKLQAEALKNAGIAE